MRGHRPRVLVDARGYLSGRYFYATGAVTTVPDHVISAYEKLMTRGLFRPRRGRTTMTAIDGFPNRCKNHR
jgi:hypothetical protein